MQIILLLSNKYEANVYLRLILNRLERDGFNLNCSRKQVEMGMAHFAVIDNKEEYDKENKSLIRTKEVITYDTISLGYMFCLSFKGKLPLSPKALFDNYEELIINKNKQLLMQLYTSEREKWNQLRQGNKLVS
jgi:hypothetical protein